MQKGGKRPGAGRKKGSTAKKTRERRILESEARAYLIKKYLTHWDKLSNTALALAEGKIKAVEYHGKIMRVFTRPPDPRTLQNVLETIVGKATQPMSGTVNMPELVALADDIRKILTPDPKKS